MGDPEHIEGAVDDLFPLGAEHDHDGEEKGPPGVMGEILGTNTVSYHSWPFIGKVWPC